MGEGFGKHGDGRKSGVLCGDRLLVVVCPGLLAPEAPTPRPRGQARPDFVLWVGATGGGLLHGLVSPLATPGGFAWVMARLTVAIAAASAWLVNSAARRLGKQWALAARVVDDHTLIQDGP